MPWKYKLLKKVDNLRRELSLLMIKDPPTRHSAMKIRRIHRKYKLKESQIKDRIREHQSEIKGLAATIRKKERPPDEDSLDNFWRPLYETEKIHKEGEWI